MKYTFSVCLAMTVVAAGSLAAQSPLAVDKAPAKSPSALKGWTPPKTADGHPDLQGIWNSGTGTPLERPEELKDKAFFTQKESDDWKRMMDARTKRDNQKNPGRGVGTYNDAFWEIGTATVKTMRTSMISEPADGRLPALLPAAQAEADRKADAIRRAEDPETMRLGDQCLMFSTGSPPMTPYNYNSNYRIVQSKDQVAIYVEMIHDTRIIPTDGRPHISPDIRLWYGDSVGRWEGDTLVVDTTNFRDETSFFGSDRNMHVVERFRRYDAETILYQSEVDDPTAFTKPFRGEYTMGRATGPIYEYACHEGNYALPGVLRGARAEEAAAAKAGK